jgi:ABC-type multidrug transport system fused ATPase/permease subunit
VALCGRTGCGKSTFLSVLAKLYPIEAGDVVIDGRNLRDVPLGQLRSSLRVVTQDPVLLSGTVRRNLLGHLDESASNRSADQLCWDALSKVGLDETVRALPEQLDFQVDAGGQNFSVGERQLLCLARALMPATALSGRPIFLCDEPTANIDLASDERIHRVLLGLDATVVMICHRLQHISSFDSVVVLDKGCVVEVGPPAALLAEPTSRLSKLVALATFDLGS